MIKYIFQCLNKTFFIGLLLVSFIFSTPIAGFAQSNYGESTYGFCYYNDLTNPDCFNITISESVNKTTANRGEQITYTINYANQTSQQVPDAFITNMLNTNLQFISCSGGLSCSESGGLVTFNLGNLAAVSTSGSSGSVTIVVQVKSSASGVISNQSTVDSPVTNPKTTTENVDVTVTLQNPVVANDSYSTNKNTAKNLTVLINDIDPDGSLATNPCSLIITQNGTLGNAVVNASNCTIDYTPNSNVTGNDEIRYTVKDVDNLVSNVGIVGISIINTLNPVLQVTKSSNKTSVFAGENIEYTLNYANTGQQNATGVIITDTLSNLVDYVASSCVGCVASVNGSGQTVLTWTIGNVTQSTNANLTFQVQVKANSTGSIPNTANVDSTETNVVNSNQVLTSITAPTYSFLANKTVDKASVDQGNEVTYTLSYQNTGNTAQTNVVLTDVLSTSLDYVASSCVGCVASVNGGGQTVLTWTIPNVATNASANLTFKAVIKTGTSYFASVANAFNIKSNQYVGINSNSVQSIVQLTGNFLPEILVTSSTKSSVSNKIIDYNVKVTNSSPIPLSGVVITTQLDNNLDFVEGSCQNCSFNSSTRIITWNIGAMNTGEMRNFAFQAKTKIVPNIITGLPLTVTSNLQANQTVGKNISSSSTVILVSISDLIRTGGVATDIRFLILLLILIVCVIATIEITHFFQKKYQTKHTIQKIQNPLQ